MVFKFNPMQLPLPSDLGDQVARALREDVGSGDLTAALVPAERTAQASIITREPAILCGRPWVEEVFCQIGDLVRLHWQAQDGDELQVDQTICRMEGSVRALLTGERTALNFLQMLSGTATAAHRFAGAVAGTACQILDTRKTVPGLRTAQKYAVRCGGARNHRMGLHDAILIKENHIAAAGSIAAAVAAARRQSGAQVEVEVENFAELRQALAAQPDMIMLDEFALDDLKSAVQMSREYGASIKLEASGSVSLANVRAIAETGVDYISVGAITKHLHAIDLSMRIS